MLLNPDLPLFLFLIVVCSKMKAIHLKRKSKLWRLDIILHVNCDTCINLELSFLIQIQACYNYFLTIIIHDWTLTEYSQQRKKVGKYVRKMRGSREEPGGVPDKKNTIERFIRRLSWLTGLISDKVRPPPPSPGKKSRKKSRLGLWMLDFNKIGYNYIRNSNTLLFSG